MRRTIAFAPALFIFVLGFALWCATHDPNCYCAVAAYNSIKPGMTRHEVWELMNNVPTSDSGYDRFTALDYFEVDGRFQMFITFAPEKGETSGISGGEDSNSDRWPLESKMICEKPNNSALATVEKWLCKAGISTGRPLFIHWQR